MDDKRLACVPLDHKLLVKRDLGLFILGSPTPNKVGGSINVFVEGTQTLLDCLFLPSL